MDKVIINLDPRDFPMQKGESWWLVHKNNANAEFRAPVGAWTLCTDKILDFKPGTMYEVTGNEEHAGWICVGSKERITRMPYYLFARYFDSECFVKGTFSVEGKKIEPFDYKSTVEKFEDGNGE